MCYTAIICSLLPTSFERTPPYECHTTYKCLVTFPWGSFPFQSPSLCFVGSSKVAVNNACLWVFSYSYFIKLILKQNTPFGLQRWKVRWDTSIEKYLFFFPEDWAKSLLCIGITHNSGSLELGLYFKIVFYLFIFQGKKKEKVSDDLYITDPTGRLKMTHLFVLKI